MDNTDIRKRALVVGLLLHMDEAGSWCGETHLQKTMYALDSLLGVPTDYEFILYRHGPYSFDLHEEILNMIAIGLLEVEPRYPYGPSLQPTKFGEALFDRFPKMAKRLHKNLEFIAEHFSVQGVESLEKYATAIFVIKNSGLENIDDRAKEVTMLKHHISFADAKDAIQHVENLQNQAKVEGLNVT